MNFLQKRAFLFDLDGTLVDSSGLHEKVFREVLNRYAPQLLDNFDYERLKGKPTAESFREMGVADGEVLDTLVNEKQGRYRNAVLAGELRLMPGAREMLEFLQTRGRRLFIVSGGSRRSVDTALYATGAHAFFEGIIAADDVACGKPAPDSFLLCLARYGIRAADAVGVEDSISGLESCRAAGLDAVLVNHPGLQRTSCPSFASLMDFRLVLAGEERLACA